MMAHTRSHWLSSPIRVARTPLGATLLFAVLASTFPLATLASGPMCTLACCAGRAPHAAGSCMNGSCHAFRAGQSKKNLPNHRPARRQQLEPLCGLSLSALKIKRVNQIETVKVDYNSKRRTTSSQTTSQGPDQNSASTVALTKPCQPDCGSLTSGFMNPYRKRSPATIAFADRPRPPSDSRLWNFDDRATRSLSGRSRRHVPRGPPTFC